MKCSRCGRHAEFLKIPEKWSQHLVILGDMTHDQAEMLAYCCPDCKKCFCGHCCLPKCNTVRRRACVHRICRNLNESGKLGIQTG